MRIFSEPGKGTSVELYLLRTTEAEPDSKPETVAAADSSNLEGCSVFLWEDDDSSRQAII